MTGVAGLLAAADRQARAVLRDGPDPGQSKGLLLGWAEAMEAASATLTAISGHKGSHRQNVDVLTQVSRASAAVHMDARRGWQDDQPPDPRASRIAGLLAESGRLLRERTSNPSLGAAEVSVSVVHTAWLLTHAVAISVASHADTLRQASSADPRVQMVVLLGERVRGIEQLLDARVNRRGQPGGGTTPDAVLASVLTTWHTTLHEVLARQPDPRHYAIVADANLALVARTAALATTAAHAGMLPAEDVRDRLLPALEAAARGWTRSRDQWVSLVTPDTSGSRPLMDAAVELRTVLRNPDLARNRDIPGVLAAGLAAGVEAAVVSRAGLARIVEAPADTVAGLAEKMFAERPDQGVNRYGVWASMASTQGRTPIPIPGPVRDHVVDQADQTVAAAIQARSASSILLPTSTYAATVMFAAARTAPVARREPPPRTITPSPSVGR